MPVEHFERALTEAERRELGSRLDHLRSMARLSLFKAGAASLIVCGVLAIITLLVSDAPLLLIVAFWTGLTVLFTAWTGLPGRTHARRQLSALAAGLGHNRARVVRIRSTRVVEFEEIEDEGACYAFDAGDGGVLFIQGQEFYAGPDFPNTDFSLVDVLGPNQVSADGLVMKDGARLEPERRIGREMKRRKTIPDHLEIIRADLDHLESALPDNPPPTPASMRRPGSG